MSARSRGSSVGNLVKRFESAAHGEAKTRSEPKGHPLAFAFARWWRAVQPLEKLCQTSDTNKLEQQKRADRMDKVQSKAKEFLEAEHTSKEGTFLSSTQTPSQGQSSGSTDLSGSEVEALVAAARVFLSKHRVKEPSLNVSMDRGIRLDLDSDSESEEKGARDVLAAAKLFARIQHLSGSLPDAFASSLGELWTSPPHEIQQSSWRESHDSMVLSETDKEDWQRMSAEAQLESAQEVIKEQRDLLELEQLQKEEMQKKLQDLEEMLEKRSQEAEMLCLERLQSKELEIRLKMQEENEMLQCKLQHFEEMELKLKNAEEQQERLQLEKQQWEELEKKLKKTQEQYEMLHFELERSLQEQRDMLQLERLQCEELEKKLKKTQEVVHKEENKVEQLENKVELLCQENAELQTCQVQLNEVLSERQVLLDALAVNEALNQDDMKEVLQIASGSDFTGASTTSALRNAAGVLTELRQCLASSKAQQQQLVEKCERLQARHDEDAQELERYRQLCGPVEAWDATGACGNEPGERMDDLQESLNLPNEVMSAADLAAHLRGGHPLRKAASKEVAHCNELTKRLIALQKERDEMAIEVREALSLCGRAAQAARNARPFRHH